MECVSIQRESTGMEIAAGRAGSVSPKLKGTLSRYCFFFFFVRFRELHRGEEYL